jgi:hypothetical protein
MRPNSNVLGSTIDQTTAFSECCNSWKLAGPGLDDPTFNDLKNVDSTLSQFLSRPIVQNSIAWNIAQQGELHEEAVWAHYLNKNSVLRKTSNFYAIRGNMHVKFTVNGTPFHYGSLLMHYNPYSGYDDIGAATLSNLQKTIQASMRPHIYLDPTTSTGGEMILPFFHIFNGIDLITNGGAADVKAEAYKMGSLATQVIVPLQHANGGKEGVSVVTTTWMEDVELCIPTVANPGYAKTVIFQGDDEYGTGIISAPASAVGFVAGMAADVPIIGKFARATEIGAKATSAIATLFGFSKPVTLEADKTIVVNNFSHISASAGTDMSEKLSVDPKQELTIDPRTTGLGEVDELSIQYIASKECILGILDWDATQVEDAVLGQIRVSPFFHVYGAGRIASPCYFASLPFTYWRGTLIYRFQVCASTLHKGRLRISWDPYFYGQEDSKEDMNARFTRIVDLSEERDFEVAIAWNRHSAYSRVGGFGSTNPFIKEGVGIVPAPANDNGILQIAVFNKLALVSDADTSNPSIIVTCRAGDDYEVAVPEDNFGSVTIYNPGVARVRTHSSPDVEFQGDDNVMKHELLGDEVIGGAPEVAAVEVAEVGASGVANQQNLVYFGEKIVSFRPLLKRYNFHALHYQAFVPNMATALVMDSQPNFPYFRGHAPAGASMNYAKDGKPYNYSKTTLMNYLTPAFAGVRGSIRWKYALLNAAGNFGGTLKVIRKSHGAIPSTTIRNISDEVSMLNNMHFMGSTHPGASVVDLQHNSVVSVDIPFYSMGRFTSARSVNTFMKDIATNTTHHHVIEAVLARRDDTVNGQITIQGYVAAGEDFNLFFFVNTPLMFIANDPAA